MQKFGIGQPVRRVEDPRFLAGDTADALDGAIVSRLAVSRDQQLRLCDTLRQIPRKLLVVWDGSPIHRSKVVKRFLAEGAAGRLQLELLPGYAPEMNPTRESGST